MNIEELQAPDSIEEAERPDPTMEMEPEETEESGGGRPSAYTGPEDRCEYCVSFREFSNPACQRHSFDADPGGHCPDFEGRKEDSSGTTEESYGKMGDEEEEFEEDEEEG
jgi:hypothetical protein